MNNKEFSKLRNSIAIKCVLKIILYSLISMIVLGLFVDVIYNDALANNVSSFSRSIYIWFVTKKSLIMQTVYFIIFVVISFFVIRNSNKKMVEIIEAMDKILKEPENSISLSNELVILENRLNNIRVDLISSKNKAKEETAKKNDLIMYMAHDLKTPLTSVIGYLTLLTEEKEISKEFREKYTKIALDKSLRLEELTNQFFEITKYDLHEIPILKSKIDLSFLISQLLDEFYPMLQNKNLKFELNKPNKPVYFFGDGDKLARAFRKFN